MGSIFVRKFNFNGTKIRMGTTLLIINYFRKKCPNLTSFIFSDFKIVKKIFTYTFHLKQCQFVLFASMKKILNMTFWEKLFSKKFRVWKIKLGTWLCSKESEYSPKCNFKWTGLVYIFGQILPPIRRYCFDFYNGLI